MMQSFRYLQHHLGAVPPDIIKARVVISEVLRRQEAFMRQHPEDLESLGSLP